MRSSILPWLRTYGVYIVYSSLVIMTALSYRSMVSILNVQAVRGNITTSQFTATTVTALLLWVGMVDVWSKRRGWSQKRSWSMSLLGVMVLLILTTAGR